MSKPHILVTGCAGFIGGHMVERLLAEGYTVSGVDDLSTGSRKQAESFRNKIRFIEGSICSPEIAAQAVDGVDRIIHLASVPSVPRSVANPLESANASIIGTVTLLNAARQAKVQRLVQASSSSVYGNSEIIPRVETIMPSPLSPYAVAKLTQEYYAKAFCHCYGLDTFSMRYFNVFGPRQNPYSQYAAVIPKFITGMMQGERPKIFGDGLQTRDFSYVGNVVEANLRAVTHSGPLGGEVVNIANGGATSLNQLVSMLNQLLGTDLQPEYQGERVGDVKHSHASTEKAFRLIGFQPTIDLQEGLARTVAYFKNYPLK